MNVPLLAVVELAVGVGGILIGIEVRYRRERARNQRIVRAMYLSLGGDPNRPDAP